MVRVEINRAPEGPHVIPDQYIVVFKPHVTTEQRAAHRAWVAERNFSLLEEHGHVSGHTGLLHKFNIGEGRCAGYAARIPQDLAREIHEADEVDYVELDSKVYATKIVKQRKVPSWGLARLCSKIKLKSESKWNYLYNDAAAGQGTTAYIIDTGVFAQHDDFEKRANFGFNAVPGSSNTDMNGHGTHVAGIIGGKIYGVAKKAELVAIKVLGEDGAGSTSEVIAGLNWAVRKAKLRGISNCVANMSLAGEYSQALNEAVSAAVESGLTVVVAAGNAGKNVKGFSPSSEETAITVGATDRDDKVPGWSNYGPLVDILAPGMAITSAWIDKNKRNASKTRSGTSMAAPHVTGLALGVISRGKAIYTPKEVEDKIMALALRGQLDQGTLIGGSPNVLAYNGEGA